MKPTCLICIEKHSHEDGITCSSGHFICDSDINPFLSENVFPQLHKLKKNGGKISCPNFQCEGTFDPVAIFLKMTERERSRYISIITLLSETNKLLSTFRGTLHEILVLRCPDCKTPVDPYPDACSAVMCLSCGHYYCNYCFRGFATGNEDDDRAKCHTHVAEHNTTEQKDPFLSAELVKSGQNKVQLKMLCNCLRLALSSREFLTADGRHVVALALLLVSRDIEGIINKLQELWHAAISGSEYPPINSGRNSEASSECNDRAVSAPPPPLLFGPPVNSGAQQLANAIRTRNELGCLQILQAFEESLDVNYVDPEHRHPLTSLAVLCHQIPIAIELIRRGADVTRTSSSGRSVLYVIAEIGLLDVLKVALDCNPNIEPGNRVTSEDNNYTLLHVAARYNHGHLIPYLVGKGADINAIENEFGYTPLCLSLVVCNKWAVMELLHLGADPTFPSASGRRPMYIAIEKSDITTVELLLKSDKVNVNDPIEGIPRNPVDPVSGSMTALHVAALLPKSSGVVSILIAAGADLNIAEHSNGHTPLLCALLTGNEVCAMELLQRGADARIATTSGRTAMYIAIEKGLSTLTAALLQSGFGVNERCTSENIDSLPLTLAVLYNSPSIVSLLVETGADCNMRETHSGNTPLMCAVLLNDYQSAYTILSRGADPTIPNMQGRTPMFAAAEHGNTDMIRLLASHNKVDINTPVTTESSQYCALHIATLKGHKNAVSCLLALNADKNVKDSAGRTSTNLLSGKNDPGLTALLS